MNQRVILNQQSFEITIARLCHQLIENHNDFSNSAIIGLQPRGVLLAKRIHSELSKILGNNSLLFGNLDVTFFRDDFRRRETPLVANATKMDFIIENKNVILVDDVLYTGRTIRAGLDAMLAYGRPKKVELLVLIDRRYNRDLPIQPDYTGKSVDTISSEKVKVLWKETENKDEVILINEKN